MRIKWHTLSDVGAKEIVLVICRAGACKGGLGEWMLHFPAKPDPQGPVQLWEVRERVWASVHGPVSQDLSWRGVWAFSGMPLNYLAPQFPVTNGG